MVPRTEITRVENDRSDSRHASDPRDEEWKPIAPIVDIRSRAGRPRKVNMRVVREAIHHIVTTGCQWRSLPRDFPPVSTVRHDLHRSRDDGTCVVIDESSSIACRVVPGRKPEPTAAVIDGQGVKATEGGGVSGHDAGKKVKGRKRHMSVDTQGNLPAVEVHAANLQDRDKATDVIADAVDSLPAVSHFLADGGHAGDKVACDLPNMEPGPAIEIARRPNEATGSVVIARRRVVERTFAWSGRCRRLAGDREETMPSSEGWLLIASIRRAARHIAKVTRACHEF